VAQILVLPVPNLLCMIEFGVFLVSRVNHYALLWPMRNFEDDS
jgi:hypothetical protein